MTEIINIFNKPVNRTIEGVVKADDAENLGTEVEEYVLTNDAAKGVSPLLETYTESTYGGANGVWISGFFGSGKSHLLKMLAHLLGDVKGQEYERAKVSESFLSKTDDELLKGALRSAASIPAGSILFNIDQKATLISKDQRDALLKVFVKVFNEERGFYGNDGAVAQFEEHLESRGQLDAFKEAFERKAGIPWEIGREQAMLESISIDEAFEEVNGSAAPNIIDYYQKNYSVSIESFADSVKEYLDKKSKQQPGYRLNFFVDEVGQFIADDVQLMLNLQTIAESLNTKCRGRAWVFVTSQEDMDKIIGDRTKQQSNDFSKIQARFATRVKLTSQDVEEVIAKRLLEKKDSAVPELEAIYDAQSANFSTIFNFADGAKTYRNYTSEDRFIKTYPFVTYQIPMFQAAIEGLSDHNMFEGRNSSVGERSMLGVVQEVAKHIGHQQVGYLATFDQMYAGISAALKSAGKSAIEQAERHLPDPNSEVTVLANRLLKALFLVKYVDTFKATPRNLTVLLYERFGQDLTALTSQVQEALELLESQSYVQRSGNIYSYLTNDEQEVEKEIKNVDIDSSEVSTRLAKYLREDALRTNKLKYAKNGQDFPFGLMLDDTVSGKQSELTIHVITPDTAYTREEIVSQSMGKDELRVILDKNNRLLNDLRLLLKTEKYTKHRTQTGTTPQMTSILEAKRALNASREKEFLEALRQAIGSAELVINGTTVASDAHEPVARITAGFQDLVAKTYPSLSILGGRTYPETMLPDVVKREDTLVPLETLSVLASPGEEMRSWIMRESNQGNQVTIRKITDRFQAKPYGWDLGSIEVVLGWLVGENKVSIQVDANTLARTEVPTAIRNTTKHPNAIVNLQKTYDPSKVAAFKRFCSDFFSLPGVPSDALDLARFGRDNLGALRAELRTIVASSRYPFVKELEPVLERLDQVCDKQEDWYLTEFTLADELLEDRANLIEPIRGFIKGTQHGIYDAAAHLLSSASVNLGYLPQGAADDVTAMLEDNGIFRGNKAQRLKHAADALSEKLGTVIAEHREAALAAMSERKTQILEGDYYAHAAEDAQRDVLARIEQVENKIRQSDHIAIIEQDVAQFKDVTFPALLTQLANSRPVDVVVSPGPKPQPVIQPTVVAIKTILDSQPHTVLKTTDDVDQYLDQLYRALREAVESGKAISI